MSKHRTTVYFDSELRAAIHKVAEVTERPMAWHYEKALRAYTPIKKLLAKPNMVAKISAQKIINAPTGINNNAWSEWVVARKGKITEGAATKQWKLLLKYSEPDQQTIIDASINSGWQGLFDLKVNQQTAPKADDFVEKNTDGRWRDGL